MNNASQKMNAGHPHASSTTQKSKAVTKIVNQHQNGMGKISNAEFLRTQSTLGKIEHEQYEKYVSFYNGKNRFKLESSENIKADKMLFRFLLVFFFLLPIFIYLA